MAVRTGVQQPSPSDALSLGHAKCAHNHNPQPGDKESPMEEQVSRKGREQIEGQADKTATMKKPVLTQLSGSQEREEFVRQANSDNPDPNLVHTTVLAAHLFFICKEPDGDGYAVVDDKDMVMEGHIHSYDEAVSIMREYETADRKELENRGLRPRQKPQKVVCIKWRS